jgi:hypothetical protein
MNKIFTKILRSALPALLCTTLSWAADPEVTPYRPGFGSPAALSPTGYFELEAGYDYAKTSDARSDGIGLLLKYGLTDNVGLLLGVNPYARLKAANSSASGVSDSSIAVKFVQQFNESTALGVQLQSTLPTGSRVFRNDKPAITLTGLAGFDVSGFHSDINLGLTRLGEGEAGASKHIVNGSASLSRNLSGPLSGALELSGSRQSGNNTTRNLASLGYAVNKQLVVDGYIASVRARGINSTLAGAGLTYLFAH